MFRSGIGGAISLIRQHPGAAEAMAKGVVWLSVHSTTTRVGSTPNRGAAGMDARTERVSDGAAHRSMATVPLGTR